SGHGRDGGGRRAGQVYAAGRTDAASLRPRAVAGRARRGTLRRPRGHRRRRPGAAPGQARRAGRGQPVAHQGDAPGRPGVGRGAGHTPTGGNALRVAAPAKVNLGLAVLARRGDGFHEVETLMARLDLADEVTVRLLEDRPGEVTLEVQPEAAAGDPAWHAAALAAVPTGDGNLAVRAAAAYQREFEGKTGAAAPGVGIGLVKRVPVAAGVGGGSSDPAAVLRAMEAHLEGGLELEQIAARLGSDVP